MRIKQILAAAAVLAVIPLHSCSGGRTQDARALAEDFARAYYSADYAAAARMCSSELEQMVREIGSVVDSLPGAAQRGVPLSAGSVISVESAAELGLIDSGIAFAALSDDDSARTGQNIFAQPVQLRDRRRPVVLHSVDPDRGRNQVIVVVVIVKRESRSELFLVGFAFGILPGHACSGKSRQQHRSENCNDRNYDQQFNQCEVFHPHNHSPVIVLERVGVSIVLLFMFGDLLRWNRSRSG